MQSRYIIFHYSFNGKQTGSVGFVKRNFVFNHSCNFFRKCYINFLTLSKCFMMSLMTLQQVSKSAPMVITLQLQLMSHFESFEFEESVKKILEIFKMLIHRTFLISNKFYTQELTTKYCILRKRDLLFCIGNIILHICLNQNNAISLFGEKQNLNIPT